MANKELMITLGLDSSTFTQKIKKAKELNKDLDKSFQLLSSSSKNFENTIQGLGKKQEYLNQKMDLASKEADIYAERLTECQTALEKSQEEATKYAEKLTKLKQEQEKIEKTLGKTSEQYIAISKEVKATTQLLDKANKSWIANDKRVSEASIGYKNAQIAVQEFGREAILVSEKMSAMKADQEMKELSEAIKESQRSFENMKNSVVGFDNTMEGLDKTQTHYTTQVEKMNELISKQKSELAASNKVLSDYEDELSRLNIQMAEYEEVMATMDGTEKMFDEVRAEAEALRLEYSSLNRTIEFHKDRVNSLNAEYKSNESTLAKFNQNLDASSKKMTEMNNKITFEPVSKKIKELTNTTITKLEDKLSDLNNEFDIVSTTINGLEGTISGLIIKENHFSKALEVSKNVLSEYKTELAAIKTETQKLTNEQKELEDEITKQISLLKNLKGAEWDKQAESIDKLKARYEEVNKSLDLHNKRVKTLETGYNSSRKSVAELTRELEDTKNQLESLSKASKFDVLDKNIKSVRQEIEKLDDAFNVAKSEIVNFDKTKQGLTKTTELYTQKISLLKKQMENYKSYIDANTKELDKLKKEQDELGKSCDELKLKLLSLDKASPEYSETLSKLASLQSKMKEVKEEADRLADSNHDLQREMSETAQETNELTLAQNRLSAEFKSNRLQDMGSKFTSLGNGISSIGNALMGVSVGAVGMMGAIGTVGVQFETSMSKVKALTGASAEEFERLESTAREMARVTVYTASETADALGYLALAGYGVEESIDALPHILNTAMAGAMDLATASDKATDAFASLGEQGQDLPTMLNMVAQASASSNTSVEQMLDAFIKVGGQIENLKIPLESASGMLGVLANRGIKAEQAGNSLNSILINMTKEGGEASEAMAELGVSMFDDKGKIREVEEVFSDLAVALSGLSEQRQVQLINMIGGKTQAKTLQKLLQGMVTSTGEFTDEYKKLKSEIEQAPNLNALENMANTMTDNLGGDLKILTSELQESFLTIFKKFEPQLREFVQGLTEGLIQITEKIKNLTPAQMEMIGSIAKWVVIAPMALKVIGGLTSGFGGLLGGVGKVYDLFKDTKTVINAGKVMGTTAKAVGGASKSISGVSLASKVAGKAILGLTSVVGGLSTPVLIGAGAVAAVGTAGVIAAKQLSKDCIPEIDLFADHVVKSYEMVEGANGDMIAQWKTTTTEISAETKKAVGSYLELDEGVRSTMSSLFTNSTIITGEIVNDMQSKFTTLGTTIKDGITKNAEESINSLNTLFANSQALSEEEKAKALENEALFYEQKKTNVTEIENQIMEILRGASEAKRELTLEETQTIQGLQNQLRESAIQTLSSQEVEAQIILQRMKDNDTRLTAEMVSENIKNLNEQRDSAIASANEQYEETVRAAIRACEETGSISEEQKNKIIEEAKQQRDEVIQKAEETHKGALEKVKELGKDTINEVDLSTGEIKSKWQKLKEEWDLWTPVKKFFKAVFSTEEQVTRTVVDSGNAKSRSAQDFNENTMRAISTLKSTTIPITFSEPVDMSRYKTSGSLYNSTTAQSSHIVSSVRNKSNDSLVDALSQQNQLLLQLLTNSTINIGVNVDGREIARSSAKYMETEINKINKRKNRIGGLAY